MTNDYVAGENDVHVTDTTQQPIHLEDIRVVEALERSGYAIFYVSIRWFYIRPSLECVHSRAIRLQGGYVARYGTQIYYTDQHGNKLPITEKDIIIPESIEEEKTVKILSENGYVYRHITDSIYFVRFDFPYHKDEFILNQKLTLVRSTNLSLLVKE